jgi:hypothetical protein
VLIAARRAAVISSPNLGVFAVSAAGGLCSFCWVVEALPGQVSAADPCKSLAGTVLELSGYVNTVRLHVYAVDVLARCGIHREGSR